MVEGGGIAQAEGGAETSLAEIRARLLKNYLRVVGSLLALGFLADGIRHFPNFSPVALLSWMLVGSFLVLGWAKVPETVRQWGFVLAGSGFMVYVLLLQGFGLGSIAAGCTLPVTTYIMVGARAGLTTVGLWSGAVVGLGLLGQSGVYLPPGAGDVNVVPLSAWPQVLSATFFCVGPVLVVARGVISQLERALVARSRTVQELVRTQATLAQVERFRTLGVLAGGIAHDINNSLTVIIGEMELLDIPEESRRSILDASEGATQMARQLLQSSGSSLAQRQVVWLPTDLESTLRSLRRILPANIELVEELSQECPVLADRVMLQQAILNLALNARDAMPHGGTLTLRITCSRADEQGWVEVLVADTGTGMTPSVLQQATEPLFTTKPLGKGTGLGLSNVKAALDAFGGEFELTSQLGQGTQARLRLPRAADNVHRLGSPSTSPPSMAAPKKLRLLLVDDNPGLRRLMAAQLVQQGHEVVQCETLAEASRALEGQVFAGLVSDVMLPDGSGVQLARRFRQRFPDARVLLVSGYSPSAADRAAILENEFQLLRKPFRMSDLASAILQTEDSQSRRA